ncbi:MAG: ABC transporter ATP-binding protein [Rhizobiales bacterium]|nr:ABC transporter ATP-binding protein [Hyphomicrobiales bacterium]NRB14547.1 ABC transporter ATP-binding protein [Hyphomicrobiales bacterium]
MASARGKTGDASNEVYLLEAKNITKKFGEFTANDNVSIALKAGEIHALLGENGAGKSTLVKMMYGSLQPTSGTLFWNGEQVEINNPSMARDLGIGMVFQHFSLFESLNVVENIILAIPEEDDIAALAVKIEKVSAQYGLPLEPYAVVADLSVGERQRIEIVRCLLQEPRLLIMDEPTAVLTPQEAEQLFITLRKLTAEGVAILYISHRLEEVRKLCHDATILRRGIVVDNVDPQQETAQSLAQLMVGEAIHKIEARSAKKLGKTLLKTQNLNLKSGLQFGVDLIDINLDVRAGEVLAIAGIAGNGQSELFDALSGETRVSKKSTIQLNGVDCGTRGIRFRRKCEAAFAPEERLGHGAVPSFKLSENVILTRHDSDDDLVRYGFMDGKLMKAIAARITKKRDVRVSKTDPEAESLSGGNLQKFIVGRELDRAPKVLIVNQPTWGVDAGAAAMIRQALINCAGRNAAVLVISQDLDEIFELADRIAVISRGQLSKSFAVEDMTFEKVGLLMAGAHEKALPADNDAADNDAADVEVEDNGAPV